jgi:hypothetical protein
MSFKPTEYNRKVIAWKSGVTKALKASVSTLTSKGKGDLLRDIRGYVDFNKDGDPWRVIWKFPVHGVYIFKGVARGYLMVNGRIVRAIQRGNATFLIDKTIVRNPIDWYNNVIDSRVPALADIMASYYGDKSVDAAFPEFVIKRPGGKIIFEKPAKS